MIKVSRRVKNDWEYKNFRVNGQTVRASLEMSPQRKTIGQSTDDVFTAFLRSQRGPDRGRYKSLVLPWLVFLGGAGKLGARARWLEWFILEILNQVKTELEQALFLRHF